MARLFGTDGVRGKAGTFPLDPPTVRRLGAALVRVMRHDGGGAAGPLRFLSGRDTRESGTWIEQALAAGMAGEGGSLVSAGVVPTPAIAYLTPRQGFTAGVVISASHNPFEDNGIKVFSGAGEKFTEALERQVEAVMADSSWTASGRARRGARGGLPRRSTSATSAEILPEPLRRRGMRIAVDCANGATTTVAPQIFEHLGFDATFLGVEPDGRNINLQCGSTHPAGPRRGGGRRRLRDGHRVRRRRRSRHLRGRLGRDRGRRRRDADVRQGPQGRGPAEGRRRRRHGDEQHRARDRVARRRHRHRPLPGGRQVRHGGDAATRPLARRRAVGPRHLRRLPVHRRRPRHRVERAARDGRQRPHAGEPGIGDDRVSAGADEPAGEGEGGPEQRARRWRRCSSRWNRGSKAAAACSCATPAPNRCCA